LPIPLQDFPSELCFGIDPVFSKADFQTRPVTNFLHAVSQHSEVLEKFTQMQKESAPKHPNTVNCVALKANWIKPNLAFFLAHGSKGIQRLEQFVEQHSKDYLILLDAKFSEISNSLEQSLSFAFQHLSVDGLTINPFLGEQSLRTAFETLKMNERSGNPKKIFVLCKTSESSNSELNYLQDSPEELIKTTFKIALSVFGNLKNVGFVVGANKLLEFCQNQKVTHVFNSFENSRNQAHLLCPGVGAQGSSLEMIRASYEYQCIFPLSRFLFSGGNYNVPESLSRIQMALQGGSNQ
jgi:orotidine-5'-phosphate decarboxylase